MSDEQLIGTTESVCPACLKRLPARRIAKNGDVYLEKTCPEHGLVRTVIWRGRPSYASWTVSKLPSQPPVCATVVDKGCPFDCGLCPEHRQHSCCVLLEVTQRCDLLCPVCFASSRGGSADPDIPTIEAWYRTLLASGGPYNIQLSGGEPTMRDDLPEIIALGRSLGFSFFQLNTNGFRLAGDPGYLRQLKDAGLSCVFLQFDGTNDAVYGVIRGAPLLECKKQAIDRCADAGVGVVLVPTLVPGVNTENIGDILAFGVGRMPAVRGVHFQPISYFGRYPAQPADADRITIPEIITNIERQTGGRMKAVHFSPPRAENAYCSFHGNFVLMENGELRAWKKESSCCGTPVIAKQGARQAQRFVAMKWAAPKQQEAADQGACCGVDVTAMDAFLDRVDRFSFCVSGMAFQDAWNLDLERLRECFIHVVSPDARIIPFCAYNLTDLRGNALYRGRSGR
jgi:7,8-dihydro-6-hydroxymethylpterin dimethyltransferase